MQFNVNVKQVWSQSKQWLKGLNSAENFSGEILNGMILAE